MRIASSMYGAMKVSLRISDRFYNRSFTRTATDLDPTPFSEVHDTFRFQLKRVMLKNKLIQRNWRWYHYVSLWWGSSFNPNELGYLFFFRISNVNNLFISWSTGSSLLSIGLTFGNAMGAVAIGALLSSVVCFLQSFIVS